MSRALPKIFAVGAVVVSSAATIALAADKPYSGYLTPGEFDVTSIIEPAPRKGDPRYDTDRQIFRDTRVLLNSARGALATSDVDSSQPALMRDFSCSVGVSLTPQTAPAILHLVSRAGADTGTQSRLAKDFYKRARPFHMDKGPVCQSKAELGDSFDYPSGHTTRGWTWAFVLTELAPDRAQQIMNRGRAYGESRFICGAHNESAVEAGMASASATMALVRTKVAYKQDVDTARIELAALRADPKSAKPTGCDIEAALISEPVMPKLPRNERAGQARPRLDN
jgi:acid phosphatase (class A)